MQMIARQVVDENMAMNSMDPTKTTNVLKNSNAAQGPKRTFGRDLTNAQGRAANANQKRESKGSKLSKSTNDTESKEDSALKQSAMVVDDLEAQVREDSLVDADGDSDMSEESVTPEPALKPWDEKDSGDDLMVAEYVEDIMHSLKRNESELGDFISSQTDINSRMRVVLVDWLIDVHRKFKLCRATYFLAINMVDRYLSAKTTKRSKLQLLGCTCLWIASKYHEIYAPEMDDFVYISDNAFSSSMLTEMEVDVLKTLEFELTVPTALNYAERYTKISSYYLKKERERKIIADLMMYCSEHSVLSYKLCQKAPSLVGACCFTYACLSTKVFTTKQMKDDGLEGVLGYTLEELIPVMKVLDDQVKNAKRNKHKALFKKYCSAKHSNIGKLNFARLNIAFLG